MKTSRDRLFMDIAERFAEQSTCTRGNVGAVIVRDRRIISCGYNGSPPGHPHCTEVGCDPPDGCLRTIHAEANAILWAARAGIATFEATMYSTHAPCRTCAQAIAAAGIVNFYYHTPYREARLDLLRHAGVYVYHPAEIYDAFPLRPHPVNLDQSWDPSVLA